MTYDQCLQITWFKRFKTTKVDHTIILNNTSALWALNVISAVADVKGKV